ncbi:MAG: hypothetical protein HYZ14_07495 [Bacteroidetes bacterium]|nr:hypothetical protein [Bacteroidota bacterium]
MNSISLLLVLIVNIICIGCISQIEPAYGVLYTQHEKPFFPIDSNRNIGRSIVIGKFRLHLKIFDGEQSLLDTNLYKVGEGLLEEKILLELFDFPNGNQTSFAMLDESYNVYFKFINGADFSHLFYNSKRFSLVKSGFFEFDISSLKITEKNETGKLVRESSLLNVENYIIHEAVDFVTISNEYLLLACNCSIEGDSSKYKRGCVFLFSIDSLDIIQEVWTENAIVNMFHCGKQLHVISAGSDGKLYRSVYKTR